MSSSSDFEDDVSITDFDMNLPEVLEDVADLKLPFRIYSAAVMDAAEKHETEVAIAIEAMIDAAIWGAENHRWVAAFVRRRNARRDDDADRDEEDIFGPMQ